eukprot:CAMPEP_0202857724 /NCGR_PEP_ID=MMETSP1391-20130828/551_1 /ASSEMBLY_ACC=CAM_ASM_000867 /TAXON_ID=1034604 /ORGANISM="Chlamydomonas leiostraca, Strain SAG 11-49" /LENGTH=103 /DNA_ID=CAMNT_0049536563 /DNA_START=41 /DNA_END=352 /DNA_ORIENTATION=+
MSAIKRAANLLPQLTRGFRSSAAARGAKAETGITHSTIAHGDAHHGLRPGYTYDWEHGPHYLRPDLIPGFQSKWNVVVPAIFGVAVGIPCFAVWWQQSKLKTA